MNQSRARRRKPVWKRSPVRPAMPRHLLPVIHPGAFELRVVQLETERLDQVERGARGGAQPGDVAGVRRDLGFNEDDVHTTEI